MNPMLTCLECGKDLYRPPRSGRRPLTMYCSISCRNRGNNRRRKSTAKPIANRFWPKVQKSDGCWLWTGAIKSNGYGHIGSEGPGGYLKVRTTHRVSWELHFGPIPAGLLVLHRCDVRNCVRPDHLFLGTHTDNMLDCIAKGRDRHSVSRAP